MVSQTVMAPNNPSWARQPELPMGKLLVFQDPLSAMGEFKIDSFSGTSYAPIYQGYSNFSQMTPMSKNLFIFFAGHSSKRKTNMSARGECYGLWESINSLRVAKALLTYFPSSAFRYNSKCITVDTFIGNTFCRKPKTLTQFLHMLLPPP